MNRFYYNVYDPDDQLAWPFDNSSLGGVLLLQAADGGGLLQFGPDTEAASAPGDAGQGGAEDQRHFLLRRSPRRAH
ncbi:hypothetical protein DIPPA_35532 [Diplonema papillatum]|nr:hypothetical protein DIPPA_35532 [Diplonema papillatum]